MLLNSKKYLEQIDICANALLNLWENSLTEHPCMFFMGKDFRKLKLPFIWYDILHVLNAISQVKILIKDKRLLEMLEVIQNKETNKGYRQNPSTYPGKTGNSDKRKRHPNG